jgi:hypothetical protein
MSANFAILSTFMQKGWSPLTYTSFQSIFEHYVCRCYLNLFVKMFSLGIWPFHLCEKIFDPCHIRGSSANQKADYYVLKSMIKYHLDFISQSISCSYNGLITCFMLTLLNFKFVRDEGSDSAMFMMSFNDSSEFYILLPMCRSLLRYHRFSGGWQGLCFM